LKNLNTAERLKQETLSQHQQLEKLIISRIKAIDSLPAYIHLLNHFYTFYGGLEDIIPVSLVAPYLHDYSSRRKSAILEKDLLNCGATLPPKASKDVLPEISNIARAMGALYVIEGSTLGGQIISGMIRKQLNLDNDNCIGYFTGYGDQTMAKWMEFKKVITSFPENEASILVESANDTFAKFHHWIENPR